jgi:hypothetical protein
MIVRYESDGTVVMITQNDHAKLAGLFAAHWGNARFARAYPFGSVVRAAHYHDSGWFRYETSPQLIDGKTPSYRQVSADSTQLAAHDAAIAMLIDVDPYTGLLVSKHRSGLWQSRYGVIAEPQQPPPRKLSPEIETAKAHLEAQQRAIEAGLDRNEVAVNYNLLQVWDLLSLYICSNERLAEHMIAPAPMGYAGDEGARLRLTPTSPTRITVDPYPFDQAMLEIGVVCRRLARNAFRDSDDFHAAYFAAAPQVANFTFVSAS